MQLDTLKCSHVAYRCFGGCVGNIQVPVFCQNVCFKPIRLGGVTQFIKGSYYKKIIILKRDFRTTTHNKLQKIKLFI